VVAEYVGARRSERAVMTGMVNRRCTLVADERAWRMFRHSLADAELKRRIRGERPAGPVAEALDEPKAAERDEQR
jgi:hypothetical protein